MLDVRRMHVLRAVVTGGSITAAAANLGYTPSAVSQSVAALEKQAGTPLLERVGRGVRPTEAGRLLTGYAETIGRQVAEAETALADLREGRTGQLIVRYFPTAGAALVAPALARFRTEHPAIRVDLAAIDPDDPLTEVRQGRADIAVVVRTDAEPRPGLRFLDLLDDPYRAVLPKGHPLAAHRVLDLADLADQPWIGTEGPAGPCHELVTAACGAAGFTPAVAVESGDYATAQGFVAAGIGVGLMPLMGLGNRHPDVVVRKVRGPEPVRRVCAAVRDTAPTGPALTGLVAALRAAAGHGTPATGRHGMVNTDSPHR
ncbi:LysR family transcriptional regulator [Streptomyces longispororuber]|uniref:LysR family transcriptional regulator n=1 Tax=Streptomyces longispororuber TaxID=68230 RepID=UPI00210934F5|nr:LysR family transcriptional regulator [Streptomyces longispororuber]MCQ4206067.1 LysR family transcriptional regulator [Streptomyces longispororuber]